jgi:hypothetical protein
MMTKSKEKREKKKAAERRKNESIQKVRIRILNRKAYLQPGTEEFTGRQIKPIDYFYQIEALGFY